jgi:hypothetical protein
MTVQLSEETLWAAEVAPRLRLLQASCADEPADVRQRYLMEELERLAKPVPLTKRTVYLQALVERFPAWLAPAAEPQPLASQVPAKELCGEELVEKLVQQAPNLSDAQRKAFGQILRDAGLGDGGTGRAMEVAVPPPLAEWLAGQSLDLERALRALMQLMQLAMTLERLGKGVWNDVTGDKRQTRDYRTVLGRYMAGDTQVTEQQVTEIVQETRKTIASLLDAIKWGPKQSAVRHFEIFEPAVIQANVRSTMTKSRDALSWERYKSLFEEYYPTKESVEKEIRDAIGSWAKGLMGGGGAPRDNR